MTQCSQLCIKLLKRHSAAVEFSGICVCPLNPAEVHGALLYPCDRGDGAAAFGTHGYEYSRRQGYDFCFGLSGGAADPYSRFLRTKCLSAVFKNYHRGKHCGIGKAGGGFRRAVQFARSLPITASAMVTLSSFAAIVMLISSNTRLKKQSQLSVPFS